MNFRSKNVGMMRKPINKFLKKFYPHSINYLQTFIKSSVLFYVYFKFTTHGSKTGQP